MPYILDAAAFIFGTDLPDGDLYTVSAVVDEVRDQRSRAKLEQAKVRGLRILEPSPAAQQTVESTARRTGDLAVLSEADRAVLALAYELHGILMTDDYAVQNVAAALKITIHTAMQRGITETILWDFRCTGCGRRWTKRYDDCPVCGSPLKRVRRKAKQKIQKDG